MKTTLLTWKSRWRSCAALALVLRAPITLAQTVPSSGAPALSLAPSAEPRDTAAASDGSAPPSPYEVKVGALVQADGRQYIGDHDRDNVLLRRARPIVTGTVLELVDFNFTADFGGGQVGLTDAYLNLRPNAWLQLRVGKFKPPLGLERLQSDANLPLPERALTSNLSSTRDVGLQLWGAVEDGLVTYALALLDGAADNANIDQDVGGDKDLAARVFLEPFHRWSSLGVLGVGVAASAGRHDGDIDAPGVAGLRTPGQAAMFSYLAPPDDPDGTLTVYGAGPLQRLNAELYYYYGPAGVLGESIWSRQELHRGDAVATLTHRAAHLTASYVIGGSNGYKGATPSREWNPAAAAFGALELAIRVASIQFDDHTFPTFADPTVSVRSARDIGASANWVLSRQVRLDVNFEHTRFDGGALNGRRADENFLLTRAQIAF